MASSTGIDTTMWSGNLHVNVLGTFLSRPRLAGQRETLRKAGANAAFVGFPWGATCIGRTGTNFGPRGLREASAEFLTFNANTNVDLTTTLNLFGCGDVPVVPGNSVATQEHADALMSKRLAADVMPLIAGGDHSITIGPARAFARKYRRCGLVHFDTHLDTANDVGGETLNHCCPVARAVDAGFDPRNIVTIGPSGWMNPRPERDYVRDKGINLFTLEDVWNMGRAHPAGVPGRRGGAISGLSGERRRQRPFGRGTGGKNPGRFGYHARR